MATELRAIPTTSWDTWYQTELCEAFPPNERKPLATMLELAAEGRYELLGLFDGVDLLGYATLWSTPEWPSYVMLDYLGVTAARRNGGLGARILAALAEQEAGKRTVIVEADGPDGGPEEERPLRLRRLAFYRRNGCTPVYPTFACGNRCQAFVLGPVPEDRAALKAAHRAIYGSGRPDVVIDPPPGAEPQPPFWMTEGRHG